MPIDTAEGREIALLDTSAAVALVVGDHEFHSAALQAVRGYRLGLAGHAWFETFSVLTRLPQPLRRSPADVLRVLARNFPASRFLAESESAALGPELARMGIAGGAVYDALVGATARQHGCPIISADARAWPIYESLAVEVRSLG
jgi:predicted nucleic acid-binding protein